MQNVMQALYLTRNARGLPVSVRRYTQPDVFGVREKTVRDVVGVKRGGEVGSGCGMMI